MIILRLSSLDQKYYFYFFKTLISMHDYKINNNNKKKLPKKF